MSYEGYDQQICQNGHYTEVDCYDNSYDDLVAACKICEAPIGWTNGVNQTNGPDQGVVPFTVLRKNFLVQDAKMCKCSTCSNEHLVEPAIFRVPAHGETDSLRVYVDD
jgi:hypothetical protein